MKGRDTPSSAGSSSSGSGLVGRQFEQVVLVHVELAYRLAVRLTGNAHEAEDAVQETLLRAHRAFDRFDLREHGAKAWLLKILHNVVITRRMQAGRRPTLLEDIDFDDFAAELENEPLPRLAEGQLDWEHFDQELKSAVAELIPEYREVILLWGLGGVSYKEISDILDVPIGTVMSRLYRARQMLMEKLATYARERGIRPEKPSP
ncbi:MAG: sigma-70 family RNA polymerase sigma factor [Phycisphaerae bacterium]